MMKYQPSDLDDKFFIDMQKHKYPSTSLFLLARKVFNQDVNNIFNSLKNITFIEHDKNLQDSFSMYSFSFSIENTVYRLNVSQYECFFTIYNQNGKIIENSDKHDLILKELIKLMSDKGYQFVSSNICVKKIKDVTKFDMNLQDYFKDKSYENLLFNYT